MDRLRIFTWHVHGNYLYYLTQTPHEFYLPVGKVGIGYVGRAPGFPWSERVHEVPIDRIHTMSFDCILFQSAEQYLKDQYALFSNEQRQLPAIFLEHDPPQDHPTDSLHVVDDPFMHVVHVTHFNALMWNTQRTQVHVIEHGVVIPDNVRYSGDLGKGLVVINCLKARGRKLGSDLFEQVRSRIPLDLVGMESEELGGLGEITHEELPAFMSHYRFMFNPIRYTSLGLAVCEAMTIGLPIVGLATTEMATLENNISGYFSTNVETLIKRMHYLLDCPEAASQLSVSCRQKALNRFNIIRFAEDWNRMFQYVVGQGKRAQAFEPQFI